MFQQHTSPAAHQPPHGQGLGRPPGGRPRKPHGLLRQWREWGGTCPSRVLKVRAGSAAASVVCLHLGQGVLGNCTTSTAPHQAHGGTGKIRDSKKATGSCAFMWSQGRLVFNLPEMRAGSGFSSGDKLRLQLCFAFPHASSAPSICSCMLPAQCGRNRVMLSAHS